MTPQTCPFLGCKTVAAVSSVERITSASYERAESGTWPVWQRKHQDTGNECAGTIHSNDFLFGISEKL